MGRDRRRLPARRLPASLAEWNDRYRDGVRRWWRGDPGHAPSSRRVSPARPIFRPGGRRPDASVNFVTAHDGFSLLDLVSYDHKHNEANGEGNRDGADEN